MKAIASVDENYGIGKNGKLLIENREDMRFFKETTTGHIIIMGRKTLESMGNKPLPNRTNIVLTNQDIEIPGIIVKHDWMEMVCWSDAFVIGGSQIYQLFLPYYDEIYLTENKGLYDADSFFPDFNKDMYDSVVIREGKTYKIKKYTKKAAV